jgi:ABC-2 type transport system permease protein
MSLFKKNQPKTAEPAARAAKPERKLQPLTRSSKNGLFSTALIAIAVVIVLVFNVAIGQLPDTVRQFDTSSTKIYDMSDTTLDYLANLEQDVTLTAVATKDSTDRRISTFLQRYANLSDHVTLEWIDPVAYPSALTEYDCDTNTLIVSCEATGQSRQIVFDDILVPDSYYLYMYQTAYYTSFDGEGQLTSAIDYVVADSTHTIYYTENHGESEPGTYLSDRLEKNHFSVSSLSLLQTGSIPEDCDLLLINAPTKDLTADEVTMVTDYLAAGGQVHLTFGAESFDHPNLDSLLSTYGLALTDGYVGDTSRYYAATQSYFAFFPQLNSNTDAAEGIASDGLALLYNSYGLTQTDPARDTITVTTFLTTSSSGVLLEGEDMTEGTYVLGATATEEIDDDTTSHLTVVSSSLIDDDIVGQFGDSVVNLSVFMNTITSGFEDVTNISIEAKSLETPTNTVSNAGLWSLLFLAVLPLTCLGLGIARWWKRRKL